MENLGKWRNANQERIVLQNGTSQTRVARRVFGERADADHEVQQQEFDLKKERTGKPAASHATRAAATESKWNPSCSSPEKHLKWPRDWAFQLKLLLVVFYHFEKYYVLKCHSLRLVRQTLGMDQSILGRMGNFSEHFKCFFLQLQVSPPNTSPYFHFIIAWRLASFSVTYLTQSTTSSTTFVLTPKGYIILTWKWK